MNFSRFGEEFLLVIDHDFHNAPQLATRHAVGPDQFGRATGAAKIDLGLSVTEGVNMSRDHLEDNPSRLVFKAEVEIDFRPISHF
jgi:hypothetical protein